MSEAYRGETMKNLRVSEWNKQCNEGQENVEDVKGSCRPRSYRTDENVEKVWHLLYSDRAMTV
jgi:hypothetical protein